jgi:hypothetical protein
VDDLKDKSLSYIRRWLKKIMKKVIAAIEKKTKVIEKISNTEFCIYVDSETSLKVFHCSADRDFFKINHPPLVASQHVISQVLEGVEMRLCQISASPPELLLSPT